MKYKVWISKYYFPKEIWSREVCTEIFKSWEIKASSRTEAAQKIWQKHRDELLPMTADTGASKKKISLHVNEPKAGVGGIAGRLIPIRVH